MGDPDRRAARPTRFTGGVNDPPERYDLIIIGTGSGNAIPDYLDGWKIAVVERDVFGGTCINRGCVPSKMFVLPADVAHEARHSARLGLDVQVGGADWAAIRDRVFGRIDPISVAEVQKIILQLKARGIGVVITDHNVRETLRVVDRAYLIHKGRVLAEGTGEFLIQDEQARKFYLGEDFNL